jgi:hypothetical protein
MPVGTRVPFMGWVMLCLGPLLAACGEDTPDRFTFALPALRIDISSGDSDWRQAPAGVTPNMVCAGPHALGTDCCSPPAPLGQVNCQQYPFACDPANNLCALTFDVTAGVHLDLVAGVPELSGVDGRALSRLVLQTLTTTTKGLGILPIRSAQLYVGPAAATGVGAEGVRLLGPVTLADGSQPVSLDSGARDAFSSFGRDYRTPFALWLDAHVVVQNGVSPAGTVGFEIAGRAEAVY